MKKALLYIISGILLCFLAACMNGSKLPDLRETYSYTDTNPFGAFVAKQILQASFPGTDIQISKRAFSKKYAESSDTNAIYFCISRNLFVNEDDAQAMLDYVYVGNTLFIAAANLDSVLLNRLLCEQIKADVVLDIMKIEYRPTSVQLSDEMAFSGSSFNYFYKPFANHFSSIRASYSHVVGYSEGKKANCFILFWGKGRLILHCDPRAFSNYFLLKNDNYLYLQELLKLTGTPEAVYWDDFYRNHNVRRQSSGNFSTISELMKYPPLATAFWLFLGLLSFYVLFNSKRRQKIIPVIKPNENSSIAFTETIARLYLLHRDNKNIADKMITYFNEDIRKKYFLTANATNTDFISVLSRKSGVSFEQTATLFSKINEANTSSYLDDEQLLTLNEHIQQFYKNRN